MKLVFAWTALILFALLFGFCIWSLMMLTVHLLAPLVPYILGVIAAMITILVAMVLAIGWELRH